MKVYSDSLTYDDLIGSLPDRVHLDECVAIKRSRVRQHGWTIQLSGTSTRHRNSGVYGAATWKAPPATYDEHGIWMARLYDIDPKARIACYRDAKDFRLSTKGRFEEDYGTL